jgi:hypothetical protein
MTSKQSDDNHLEFLKKAFANDGFNVTNSVEFKGKLGITAEHKTAKSTVTGKPKRAYYVEGNNYQMGYLLGMMAEPEVSRMTNEFSKKVVFSFIGADKLADTLLGKLLGKAIVRVMEKATTSMEKDIPQEYKDEMEGIYQGCKAINRRTRVDTDKLRVLNAGIDCILAHIYTGKVEIEGVKVPSLLLKAPHMCHAYSVSGDVVENNGHFFGRNFMFPTADVYQDTACLIIYNPNNPSDTGQTVLPIVSQTAPGMVGSPAAMNANGAAIGVDMLPGMLCNPERPGLNSLLLNRDCMDHCPTTEDVVNRMIDAPRGVSWLYPVADGQTGTACIVEAGANIGNNPFPYFDYITPGFFKDVLPDEKYIMEMREKYKTPAPKNGLMARWNDYNYPGEYLDFNNKLWNSFNKTFLIQLAEKVKELIGDFEEKLEKKFEKKFEDKFPDFKQIIESLLQDLLKKFNNVQYYPFYVEKGGGFINNMYVDRNCPGPYYFAPQREGQSNVLVVSNHAITPEMRLTSMNEWITFLSLGDCNDIQWRYDILNYQLQQAIDNADNKKIDKNTAWKIINNLTPDPENDFYLYYNRGMLDNWKEIQVHGSVSLCDLKAGTFKSLFGYYGDDPIEITLPNYITKE